MGGVMPQTNTTRDGHTITLAGQIGYRITDIDLLYDTLHQGENGVRSMAIGAIATYIHTHELHECAPIDVAEGASKALDLSKFGLLADRIQLTTFCRVKTYRLIQDSHENVWEDLLNTSHDDARAARQ